MVSRNDSFVTPIAQPVTGEDGGPLRVVLEEVVIKPFDANN